MTGENFISGTVGDPAIIDANDEDAINLQYGFHVESNAETQKELKNMVITFDVITYGDDGQENDIYYDTIDLTGKTSYDYQEYLFVQEREIITLMEGTIKAVVTDVDNQTNTATIAFEIQMDYEPEPLESYDITWIRRGANLQGNTAEEMADHGYNLDLCGFPQEEKVILSPEETITNFIAKREALEKEIDAKLEELKQLLEIK